MHQHPASHPPQPIATTRTISTMDTFPLYSYSFSNNMSRRSGEDKTSLLLSTDTPSYGQVPFRESAEFWSGAHITHSSTSLWDSAKTPLERWLQESPEESYFTNIRALLARTPVPGENKPWHSKTGRITTQPPRSSRRALSTRVARGSIQTSTMSSERSPSVISQRGTVIGQRLWSLHLPAAQTPTLQAPQDGSMEAHENPSSQDPRCNNPFGSPPSLSTNGDCLDPRTLQQNPDVLDNMPEFPSTSSTPPSLAMMSQPLESPGPTRPPHHVEHDPLAGFASPLFETGDANYDDSIWEFFRFDRDDEENTSQESGGGPPGL